ncbi:L-alanine-DL-glutamate epimerase or related enzyme of enolase superfamily [Halanaeroarchaeum sp. HSR-CO]|uniref:dipeptide epimerase n=1 Tax=Halanaeroarchaeum sp. HSR-CO TaxID=2866382 RepID=UPI00217CDB7F|nr:dipeptide epimerase [Halanaeroarchaeum sp. HSR-CO]UWG48787.1 L-alanine-DL-glutamate epimerase or related enzyme of enolase superfamily [Halanaeroarchaeum sp. HSR-CO]
MSLTASFERVEYALEHPFTIARGTQDTAENVIVRIEDDEGTVGVGGAAPSTHYGETPDTVEAVLPALFEVVESVGDPHQLDRIEASMDRVVTDNPSAKAAVDIALHDLAAKRVDLPLYRYLGLDPAASLETSYTIGIDDRETMREKTLEARARGFSTLKVKVGTDRDREILETVRGAAPDAIIRVDANEGWTPREAVRNIEAIAEFDVEFVEQPVPAEHPEGLRYVYERSPLPIAVDESLVRATDVPDVADRADIANLKLMKTGGIREAIRLIHAARAHGMEIMAGCMIESNASIAGAAHLTPLLDYVDLDGSILLAEDDFEGVPIDDGSVDLAAIERPGTGARI